MSNFMKLRVDPRNGKGMCSDCESLFVMSTETHGGEKIYCSRFACDGGTLIPITRKIEACTMYEQVPRGNFKQMDAWLFTEDENGKYIYRGDLRYVNGKYQRRTMRDGKYVWQDTRKENE